MINEMNEYIIETTYIVFSLFFPTSILLWATLPFARSRLLLVAGASMGGKVITRPPRTIWTGSFSSLRVVLLLLFDSETETVAGSDETDLIGEDCC